MTYAGYILAGLVLILGIALIARIKRRAKENVRGLASLKNWAEGRDKNGLLVYVGKKEEK